MPVPSIRPSEEIIERFGVSNRYTILLIGLGIVLITGTAIVAVTMQSVFARIAESFGVLGGPIIYLFALLPILGGLYLIGVGIYIRLAHEYFLTTQRVMERSGFLAQRTVSADYKTITDLVVRQDFIGRFLLNTGTLAINTAGGPQEEIILIHITDPEGRREQLRQLAKAAYQGRKITSSLIHSYDPPGVSKEETTAAPVIEQRIGKVEPDENQRKTANAEVNRVPVADLEFDGQTKHVDGPQIPVADQIEDLHGDGIDESDKVRHAQKKIENSERKNKGL